MENLDQNNQTNQLSSDQKQPTNEVTNSKFLDVVLGFIIFGIIDGILIWVGISMASIDDSGISSLLILLLPIAINIIGIIYFIKNRKYLAIGIISLFLLVLLALLLLFGACVVSLQGTNF